MDTCPWQIGANPEVIERNLREASYLEFRYGTADGLSFPYDRDHGTVH